MTEKEAALRLFDEYERLIYRKVHSMLRNEKDIPDVMQDIMENLIRRKESWQGLSPPKQAAYVVEVARNTVLNYLRHKKVEQRYIVCSIDEDDFRIDSLLSHAAFVMDLDEMATNDLLHSILEASPERDQLLLKGKFWLDLTDKELAELIGCKPSSVRTLLNRAKKRFRAELERSMESNEII